MAGAQREAVDPATADAKVLGKELSVQPDLTGKGKSTEGSASSSAAAGDKVAEMLGRLNLTSQESSAFVLEDEDDENPGCPEWAFMGKVLAPNPLHISTIKAVLRPTWGNPKGLEIRSMGTNLFMAEFATQADMDRVRGGTPWMISKHGVLLKEFDPSAKHADVCFDRLAIWAQILNLPFGLMNDSHGKGLASNIGKVEKMDVDSTEREVWSDVKLEFDLHLKRKFFTSPKTWLADFLSKESELHAVVPAVTCWHLWDVRNKLREEGGMEDKSPEHCVEGKDGREVWSNFSTTQQNIVQAVVAAADLNDWWRILNAGPKIDVVKDVTMAGYVAWNIWKERNQRIFQDKRASAISVAGLAKTEVALYRSAHRIV
ncbi:hypothetical protein ACQ4PT_068880 [Festuca glaucescens]